MVAMSYISKTEYGEAWPRMWEFHQQLMDLDENQLAALRNHVFLDAVQLYAYEHVLRLTESAGRIDQSDVFVRAVTGLLADCDAYVEADVVARYVVARVARALVVSDQPDLDESMYRVIVEPAREAGLL